MSRTTRVVPSFCRLCNNVCPILVHVEDGRAVKVVGDPEGAVHQGYSCHRGRALPALTYAPERLLNSLKRAPDGSHVPISSEAAIDEIAERLRDIIERDGPRSVALYMGTQSGKSVPNMAVADGFMDAIGSPMRFSANTIDQPGKQIAKGLHGYWLAPPHGFDRPDVVLWIGINPLMTYTGIPTGNPRTFFRDIAARGAKIIAVDPRRTEAARRAWLHLQPVPGEDVAILAGMLRVIIEEGLDDAEFVEDNVTGLDALRRAVDPFTPDHVAARAGVPVDDLVRAARTFGSAARGYACAGVGPNMSTGQGTLFEYLVLALDTICGHYQRAGEEVRAPGTLTPTPVFKAQAAPPAEEALGFGERLRIRGLTDTLGGLPTPALPEEILTPGEGRVRALIVVGGNPVVAWPDQALTARAMRDLELLVTLDARRSQTSKLAHYVIAPKTTLEVAGLRGDNPFGYANAYSGFAQAYAQYTPAVVDPPRGADVIEEWEFFYGVAKRLGLQLHLGAPRHFVVTPMQRTTPRLRPIDMDAKPTTEQLIEHMTARARVPLDEIRRHPHGGLFPPEAPIVVQPKDAGCEARLDVGNPLMMRDLDATYAGTTGIHARTDERDFRLVGRRQHQYNSSFNERSVNRGRFHNPAFLHPDDLERLGLAAGDLVELGSAHATIVAIAEPDPNVRPGVVSMAHAFGDVPGDDDQVRRVGSNTNRLLTVDQIFDRYSGQPLMSNVPVSVHALGHGSAHGAGNSTAGDHGD